MLALFIQNDGTGTERVANYEWRVEVNGKVIASGYLPSHRRSDGWAELVRRVAEIAMTVQQPKTLSLNHCARCTVNADTIVVQPDGVRLCLWCWNNGMGRPAVDPQDQRLLSLLEPPKEPQP